MNKKEHLLTCLSEEASEVIKDVSKGLRFGIKDINPGTRKRNCDSIKDEIIDFIAVAEMLVEEGIIDSFTEVEDIYAKEEKKEKVRKYMEYAKEQGTLE